MSALALESNGYMLIDDFLGPEDCRTFLEQIGHYREHNGLPEIYRPTKRRSLRYFVIDGEEIRANLPSIWKLYRGAANELVNELIRASIEPLQNIKAGVNVNVMPPGRSEYRWHYDRTAVTAILYLNQVEGGETELYPNYRILLNGQQDSRLQLMLDRCLQPGVLRRLVGRKKVVQPHPGRLVAMLGNRCWHSFRAVRGSEDRINIILAYDTPEARFGMEEGLDSYLYTQERADSKDPNYAP
ncbi:MAG: 2OG-Fe(II) oxygenase [Acidimicrobiia bacterium]